MLTDMHIGTIQCQYIAKTSCKLLYPDHRRLTRKALFMR